MMAGIETSAGGKDNPETDTAFEAPQESGGLIWRVLAK